MGDNGHTGAVAEPEGQEIIVAGCRRWAWVATLWIGVLVVALANAGLWLIIAPQLAADPLVGTGSLDAPATAAAPTPVLSALGEPDATVDAATLTARLNALPADGVGDVLALVVDARTGEEVYRRGEGVQTPASSLKVLSALVAVDVLGDDHRFTTTALLSDDAGTLILDGGGDPLLAGAARPDADPQPASLEDLAADTAAALASRGITTLALGYDASLFGGPAWNPAWPDIFARSVAPITALTADHGRLSLAEGALERASDPSLAAAETFASYLAADGITITGIAATTTPANAATLATVTSPTVAAIAAEILAASDNDAAEILLWQAALARGHAATPTGAAAFLAAHLESRGLWSDGMAVQDGNGIASTNLVTADALVGAIRQILTTPDLSVLATGLPVAGVSGTLTERFTATDALAGRGLVRAKTGTIRGVNTLTGYVVTADGQLLAFAFMTSGGAGQTSARAWLDRVTATLASCGCS